MRNASYTPRNGNVCITVAMAIPPSQTKLQAKSQTNERRDMDVPQVPQEILDVMHHPGVYYCDMPGMGEAQTAQLEILYDFNATRPSEGARRRELIERFFAEAGEGLYIEPPLHANWGCSTHWGAHCYANFNLTLVDDGEIFIGDHTMIGPNVTLVTTGHPIRPDLRERIGQYSEPIHIGRNVWIGAGVTVLPGVTIGDNSVIGANSLVTKDIPADSVAYGSPCKVVRPIGPHDYEYYWRDRRYSESRNENGNGNGNENAGESAE